MRTIQDLFDLRGRVALVTGGTGHLGSACAEALAELGAGIVLADMDPETCRVHAEALCTSKGVDAVGIAADLAHPEAAARTLVDETIRALGRLDILVNNAAYTGTTGLKGWAVPFEEQSVEAWNEALAVNLTTPFVLARAAREALAAGGHGSVINIASIYGIVGPQWSLYEGTPMTNPAGYGVTKGGLIQLTRYLSTTFAPSIRVNCIAPGGVARGQPDVFRERYEDRVPLQRMAIEQDLKGAFAFLASDASAYVTGQVLMVDGGWTTW